MSGSQSALREANRGLIIETVHRHGGLTQVELAGATGLSTATVSTIVKELLAAGVVDTRNTTRSGRRAQMVTIARRVGLAVGIHIGVRQLRVALGDATREVLAEQTLPLPHEHRMDTSLDRAALLVTELLERVGSSVDEVVGVGIALPAPVDAATGMISVRGMMSGWDEIHIGHVLSKRLGCPVFVDNDANLGALAESVRGAARFFRDSVFVRVSYGTGAGIVLGSQVHVGFAGTAGEIGHVQVDPDGQLCRCGSRGCLDTVVGAAALTGALRETHGTLTLRDIVQGAIDGDPGCARVIAEAGSSIGVVVAGLVIALNPQVVVVGGELAETGEVLVAPLREAIRQRVLPNQIAPLEVVAAELGEGAEVIGALESVFRSTDFVARSADPLVMARDGEADD